MTGDTLTTSPTGTRLQIPGRTAAARLIVVVRAAEAAGYDRVLEVLVDAGIRSVELTLTTPGTIARLPRLIAQFGEDADIGVGTVTNGEQVAAAVDAGAHYLVTPITDPALVDAANRAAVPIVPGGLTPTELFAAWRAGPCTKRGAAAANSNLSRFLYRAIPDHTRSVSARDGAGSGSFSASV